MINPGTSGLAMLLKQRKSCLNVKMRVLKIRILAGCSYSPLS